MLIVNERFDRLKRQISPRTWDRIRHKAKWEGITLSAVIYDWGDAFLPARLKPLARRCFVETRHEWLRERRVEVAKELRRLDRELARVEAVIPSPAVED